MGSRRFLFTFGLAGGLVAGLLIALLLEAVVGLSLPLEGWAAAALGGMATFLVGGWVTWYRWAWHLARARRRLLGRLAGGDLTPQVRGHFEEAGDLRRLVLSLRRALSQVQRVTRHLHRTSTAVGEEARALLEAARRQGAAVERTLTAVGDMGRSLEGAGEQAGRLEAFARETTAALAEMSQSVEQVASALSTLNGFVHTTAAGVQEMSERLSHFAASGDALVRFAAETEAYVGQVGGSIDLVRQRARETGDLARQVRATAEQGAAQVRDSVRGMDRLEQTVRRAAGLVEGLGARGLEIGRIVDVIQEVADQTHLLALNASIIASQSGEHGRAFGVVAHEVRGLAERTARSAREIARMVAAVREEVESAVALTQEGRAQAAAGVLLGDRAAQALRDIGALTERTFSAIEATEAEAARLEAQGQQVAGASRTVAHRVDEAARSAASQAAYGQQLVRQTQEMARVAEGACARAEGQAQVGRQLGASVGRLTQAIEGIRAAHRVLTEGEEAISEEVGRVREDAHRAIRIGDGLSRTVEQLAHEAATLEAEVFRFQLPSPRRGGTLRAALHQAANLETTRGLDPLFTLDNQLAEASALLFSTLLRSEDGVLVPELAERWETDRSARRYRFTLRQGLTFHDGVPLTAAHVKAHLERLLHPEVRAPDAWAFLDVEGARDFREGRAREVAGLAALDAHTLEVRLCEPRAFFLHLVTLSSTGVARWEEGQLVGCGPFRPLKVAPEGLVLERNPAWFRPEQPRLERLELLPCASREEALQRLEAGEVDVVSSLFAEHVQQGLEGQQVVGGNTPSCWFLAFHVRTPPFDDVRVRRALRAGLDVAGVVERFHPGARAARSLTPPELLEGAGLTLVPRPDLAQVRRLLAEAGVRHLHLTLPFPTGRGTQAEDAVLFAPLVEAGLVTLCHEELRPQDFYQRVHEGRAAVFRAGWIADFPDPDNFLHFLLHSGGQSVYRLGYANAELDALVSQARTSIDPGQRQALYRKAEALLARDVPLIPLFHDSTYAAATARVQGLRQHQVPPQVRYEDVWLDAG